MMIAGQKQELSRIMNCNIYTDKFGIVLSEQDVKMLLQSRKDNLKTQERIEFGEGILPKLIYAFCDSQYIYQDNYTDMLGGLQEIFYLYKNESLDEVPDDDLIEFMKHSFEGECQGSLNYLEETVLEKYARDIRSGCRSFIGDYNKNDE